MPGAPAPGPAAGHRRPEHDSCPLRARRARTGQPGQRVSRNFQPGHPAPARAGRIPAGTGYPQLPPARQRCSRWPHELVAVAQGRAQIRVQLTPPKQVQNRGPGRRGITAVQATDHLPERVTLHVRATHRVKQGRVE
jgi:hypothetical protein